MSRPAFLPLAGLLAALALLAAPAVAAPLAIPTACRATGVRMDGELLLWQDGSGRGADLKKGCKGETRAAWVAGGEAKALDPDFLGAGFRAAGSGARAAALGGGRVVLVWAESGKIAAALFAPGATTPERRFEITSPDTPSDVAAPRPLATADGGFVVFFESDFFAGRRRNPVWRAFGGGEAPAPAGEMLPAFADFVTVREPLAAQLASGAFAVGGPGIGPLGDGFFLEFWGKGGESLDEPQPADEKRKVLGGDLAAAKEIYVFTWNIRSGAGTATEEKALLRLYSPAGEPLGKSRELGPAAGTPAAASLGGQVAIAWVEPGPPRRIRLLLLDPADGAAAGVPQDGSTVGDGVAAVAIDAAGKLLAWAEADRIEVAPLP